MTPRQLLASAALAAVTALALTPMIPASADADRQDPHASHREHRESSDTARPRPARTRSPNLVYHGGKIMPSAVTKAIYWGASWADPAFVGDKIAGLDQFYVGHDGSRYAATVNEYTDTVGGGHVVGSGLVHQGNVVDTSAATGGTSTAPILAEVQKQVTAGAIVPDPAGNGYYPVYTDVPRGSAGFCAWHSSGTVDLPGGGRQLVQFAFFFNLDGDPGCNPNDTTTGHSQGLAALANVSAHELEEARSDPNTNAGWFDSSGQENGDKCGWTFNVPAVTLANGTQWKLQGEWSNAAYSAGTGYPNSAGQKGCIDGH